jgi:hypothetical protein
MQVGDLVTVAPAKTGTYIITALEGYSSGVKLPDCVMLVSLNGPAAGYCLPMGKEFIEVISASR